MEQNTKVRTDFSEVERLGEELKFREIDQNFTLNQSYANQTFFARHKFYHYKELLRVALTNFNTHQFQNFKNSIKIAVAGPVLVGVCFQILNPFSLFYKISVYGVMLSGVGNIAYSLRQDMFKNAKTNTKLGSKLRYHFTELSYYDQDVMSFQDYTNRYNNKRENS